MLPSYTLVPVRRMKRVGIENLGEMPYSATVRLARTYADVAQLVERIHGKDKVSGSIPDIGSKRGEVHNSLREEILGTQ